MKAHLFGRDANFCTHEHVEDMGHKVNARLPKNNACDHTVYEVPVVLCHDCGEVLADFGAAMEMRGGSRYVLLEEAA